MVLQLLRLRVVVGDRALRGHAGTAGAAAAELRRERRRRASPRGSRSPGTASARSRAMRRGRGARTGIVLMPARFQVDDADYGRLQEAVAAARRRAGARRRDRAFRDGARRRCRCRDRSAAGAARGAARPGPVLPGDVHLTPRGHEVVADALDAFIDEQQLLRGVAPRADPAPWSSTRCTSSGSSSSSTRSTGCCRTAAQNWLLLVASYYFYAAWDWRFLGLLARARRSSTTSCAPAASTQRPTPRRRQALLVRQPRLQPDAARVLQVLQLLRRQPARAASARSAGSSTSSRCACCCRSASRSTRS